MSEPLTGFESFLVGVLAFCLISAFVHAFNEPLHSIAFSLVAYLVERLLTACVTARKAGS